MKTLMLIALSTLAAGAYAADNEFYAGANTSFLKYQEKAGGAGVTPSVNYNIAALEGVAGYNFYEMLSVEARLGVGIEDDTELDYNNNLGTAQTPIYNEHNKSIDYYGSIYLRGELSNDTAKLYGLLGFSGMGVTTTVPGGAESDDSDSGLSYGIGVGFFYNEKATVNFEWKKFLNSDDSETTGLSIGFDLKI